MSKHDNFEVNFSLKGFTSIQIGIYFLLTAYVIKSILDGFLIDDNTLGMLSAEIIEILIIVITFFTLLFSSLALFFKGRRVSKKYHYRLWNGKTKTAFWKYFLSFLVVFTVLILLMKQGFIDYITPAFLILYGVLLFFLRNKERKNFIILSVISILLGFLCFVIPSYWYSSLFILGVAHITYGVISK